MPGHRRPVLQVAFPGGHVEAGESDDAAVAREVAMRTSPRTRAMRARSHAGARLQVEEEVGLHLRDSARHAPGDLSGVKGKRNGTEECLPAIRDAYRH